MEIDHRTRKQARARTLCSLINDERRTEEELVAVDELLMRMIRGDRSSLVDQLLSMLFDETEHPDAAQWNAAMRQAIRVAMAHQAIDAGLAELAANAPCTTDTEHDHSGLQHRFDLGGEGG